MTIEEIRANAPDGAMYYFLDVFGVVIYYKMISGKLMLDSPLGWIPSILELHEVKPLH